MWRLVKNEFEYNKLQIILLTLALIIALIFLSILGMKVPDYPIAFIFAVLLISLTEMIVLYKLLNIEYIEHRLRLQSLLPITVINLSLMRIGAIIVVHITAFSLLVLWLMVVDLNIETSKLNLILFMNGILLFFTFWQRLLNEIQYLSLKIRLAGFVISFPLPIIFWLIVISSVKDVDLQVDLQLVWHSITSIHAVLILNLMALIFIVLCHFSFINRFSYASTHKVEFSIFDYIASLKRSF